MKFLVSILAVAVGCPMCASAQTASEAPEDGQKDDIIVTGRARQLYDVSNTKIGKVAEDPLNIPQSVDIINAQLIQDQGARQITDLYRDVAGVSFFSYSGVTFRGFRQQGAFYDGLRGDPYQAFSVPQLFTIERVEFLKGPAGMLFGPGSPGGTINYVTKKPGDTFAADARGIVGTFDRVGTSADITAPITADGSITGRLGGFYERFDDFRRNASNRTAIGDAGLQFKLGDRTKATVQATYADQNLPGNRLRGVPVDRQGNLQAGVRFNAAEPTDFMRLNTQYYQALVESELSDAVSVNVSGRWFRYNERQQFHNPIYQFGANGRVLDSVPRDYADQIRRTEGLSTAANVIAKLHTGGIAHTVLVGGDWYQEDALFRNRGADPVEAGGVVPPISLSNPVYRATPVSSYGVGAIPFEVDRTRATRYGVYAQDQIALGDHVLLVGGVRHDWFRDRDRVAQTGADGGATTWRGGAIYKPRSDISIYLSWSDSFEPQSTDSQATNAGGPFSPMTGNQIEGGVKTALFGGKVQAGIAAYRIVRRNMLQVDSAKPPVNGVDQLAPIGEVTSKGVELTISTDITRNWLLLANYAYNDTRITGTLPGQSLSNAVGDRFVNAPESQGGFWTRYQIAPLRTAFAAGGQYVSAQRGFNGERVKPYVVFDSTITTDLGFAQVMLRIENLFDREYAASGFGLRNGSFPGKPRTAFVEFRKRF
ncbi:TonB-dependent receptor [Sphingomonas panacis]|uniref:TonB-dependent receptor n=1 Tax=Sphingomonas panacis TaxID=1560345 RepID=A0A1B3Z5A9_9SPHN|nr:TonB-dependent receptor [Sphingomonas panacis]